jgi:hypothetical protein
MTKDDSDKNPDELKKDLESLDLKIKDALTDGNLSEEGLKTLIKEAEEMQKRLVQPTENSQDKEEKP